MGVCRGKLGKGARVEQAPDSALLSSLRIGGLSSAFVCARVLGNLHCYKEAGTGLLNANFGPDTVCKRLELLFRDCHEHAIHTGALMVFGLDSIRRVTGRV